MRQTVFHYICDHGPCTSRDIAEGLRLHPIGRVTVQIKNLAHKQFIRSPGFEPRDPDHKHRMRLWEATKPRDARIPMDPPPNTLKRRDHQARNKDADRARLAQHVDEFLARGKQIEELPGPAETPGPGRRPGRSRRQEGFTVSDGFYIGRDYRIGAPPERLIYEPPLADGERRCLDRIARQLERALHVEHRDLVEIDRTDALILTRALRRAEQEATHG